MDPLTAERHIGRHWPNAYEAEQLGNSAHPTIESECPCPREPCGLIATSKISPDCTQHAVNAAKTMRSGHYAKECPGARS